jgi:hypothetical protein
MAAMEDPFQPFRELMIPLSGVSETSLLQRGDKKIFLIGERHTPVFCRDKGFTPLCSIIEEYLLSRTEDKSVDFMIERNNEDVQHPPLEETRENCSKWVNPSHAKNAYIIDYVRHMVSQYIPHVSNPVLKTTVPRTFVELPNARVHWLDPFYNHPKTRGDLLIYFMTLNMSLTLKMMQSGVNQNRLTSLYICRSIINSNLRIEKDSETAQWALEEPRVIESYNKDPSKFQSLVFDTIPDRELFLQSSESSKREFFKKVYKTLADSKYFKKCYDGGRFIDIAYLQDVFYKAWIDNSAANNTIEFFYFIAQRFLMDFFTCCRILKEDGRWYKNIVIYAGSAHTRNIERILLLLDFQNVPLPPIPYNPTCSATGGKSRQRKKRKTRRGTIKRQ